MDLENINSEFQIMMKIYNWFISEYNTKYINLNFEIRWKY